MPVLNNKHVSDLEQVMMMIDDVDADLRNDYKTNRTALMYLNEIQNRLNEIHKSIQNKRMKIAYKIIITVKKNTDFTVVLPFTKHSTYVQVPIIIFNRNY